MKWRTVSGTTMSPGLLLAGAALLAAAASAFLPASQCSGTTVFPVPQCFRYHSGPEGGFLPPALAGASLNALWAPRSTPRVCSPPERGGSQWGCTLGPLAEGEGEYVHGGAAIRAVDVGQDDGFDRLGRV